MWASGERLWAGLERIGREHGFAVEMSGLPSMPTMTIDRDDDFVLMNRFAELMAAEGSLVNPTHNWFLSTAHTAADIDETLEHADAAFRAMANTHRGLMPAAAMQRVVLVGCGRQATRAHLPVLDLHRERVKLVAVVDLADQMEAARNRCAEFGLGAETQFLAANPDAGDAGSLGPRPVLPTCEGLIVSSPPLTHKPYIDAALSAGDVAILVDKPLTVRANARSSIGEARAIVEDFDEINRRSRGRLVMVGTQRRYHPLYRRIGRHLHAVHARTGQGVTFVQSLTNDGLWNDSAAYLAGGFYDPAATGGGKLDQHRVPPARHGAVAAATLPALRSRPVRRRPHPLRGRLRTVLRARGCGRPPAERRTEGSGKADESADERDQRVSPGCVSRRMRNERSASGNSARFTKGSRRGGARRRVSTKKIPPAPDGRSRTYSRSTRGRSQRSGCDASRSSCPTKGRSSASPGTRSCCARRTAHLTGADGSLEHVVGPYVDTDGAPTEEFLAALLGGRLARMWHLPSPTRRSPCASWPLPTSRP